MALIITKRELSDEDTLFVLACPDIARKHRPGQFVIVRHGEGGERIPLTIADSDAREGTITIIFKKIGLSTKLLGLLEQGEEIDDVAGPLGTPTHLEKFGTVVCIGGGVGVAPLHAIAKGMAESGNSVVAILGARMASLLILEDEMEAIADEVLITTDDGSKGIKGFGTDELSRLIEEGRSIDLVVAAGPVVMMRAVCELTREFEIPTVVSLNPIMVDGTGMCGGCRVSIGGETKFACVDGPEFDGHLVDFDLLIQRQRTYIDEERHSLHECRALQEKQRTDAEE